MTETEQTAIVINRIGTLRRVTVKVLEDIGFCSTIECGSVYEAQEHMEREDGHLVIILEFGIAPPSKDEITFLQRYSHPSEGANIQIVVTSQKATTEFVMSMVRLGITKVIIKSYDLQKFTDRLDYVIEKKFEQFVPSIVFERLFCEPGAAVLKAD